MPELTGCCRQVTLPAQHSTAQHSTAQHSTAQLRLLYVLYVSWMCFIHCNGLCLQWTVLAQLEIMRLVMEGSHSALQHSMAHKAHHGTL